MQLYMLESVIQKKHTCFGIFSSLRPCLCTFGADANRYVAQSKIELRLIAGASIGAFSSPRGSSTMSVVFRP